LCAPAEFYVCSHGIDILPRNPDRAAAAEPAEESAHQTGSSFPRARSAQDRHDLQRTARIALEFEVVRVAAASPLGVEELAVHEVESDVDGVAQFWPTFVRIISGIADSETMRMTTR
jgi:hypothetical protein